VGSFPITFVFANLGWSFVRYAASGWQYEYAPIGNPAQTPNTRSETIGVITVAAGLSVTVALIDYFVGRAQRKKQRTETAGSP
jgi:hypothetical protein